MASGLNPLIVTSPVTLSFMLPENMARKYGEQDAKITLCADRE